MLDLTPLDKQEALRALPYGAVCLECCSYLYWAHLGPRCPRCMRFKAYFQYRKSTNAFGSLFLTKTEDRIDGSFLYRSCELDW